MKIQSTRNWAEDRSPLKLFVETMRHNFEPKPVHKNQNDQAFQNEATDLFRKK